MRTTLNLDDELMTAAKVAAAKRGVTLTSVIEGALRAELAGKPAHSEYVFTMPVVHGTAPLPVDISDRVALYDLIDPVDGHGA